jgi:hypothetical protein
VAALNHIISSGFDILADARQDGLCCARLDTGGAGGEIPAGFRLGANSCGDGADHELVEADAECGGLAGRFILQVVGQAEWELGHEDSLFTRVAGRAASMLKRAAPSAISAKLNVAIASAPPLYAALLR